MFRQLLLKMIFKGDKTMMAMFFAQRVILGKTKFSNVPKQLKDAIREHLIDSGLGYLIDEEDKTKDSKS